MTGVGDTASHCSGLHERTNKGRQSPFQTLPRHTASTDRDSIIYF